MPEGHTLHRLARLHHQRYAGQVVRVDSPQGRFTTGAAAVDGALLERAEAHGKHLFHVYAEDRVVHLHLGLYGKFTEHKPPVLKPRGKVWIRITGSTTRAAMRRSLAYDC